MWWEILPELRKRGATILTDTDGETLVQAMREALAGRRLRHERLHAWRNALGAGGILLLLGKLL